jgi:hypothetical protein
MARAVADSTLRKPFTTRRRPRGYSRSGAAPPGDRLNVLDRRARMEQAVGFAARHRTNLLLSDLAGAELHHRAAIRVTPANQGKAWSDLMNGEDIDFVTVEP